MDVIYKWVYTCICVTEVQYKVKQTHNKNQNSLVAGVIFIVIGAVMVGNVFIPVIDGVNTSSFDTSENALWDLLTLFGILGLVVGTGRVFGLL